MTVRVGSDTGGTFTDLVGADGRIAKVLSTPDHPGRAVVDGLAELLGDQTPDVLCHGTTVGTNALLERRGATVALVTNQGFADLIEIARQDRPSLYDQEQDRPEPLVARHHRYEVSGRLAADGSELERCDPATLPVFADDVEAVAVTLLHADVEPAHEQLVAAAVAERGLDVTASHTVSPEFREYERTVTTVVNAYLRPACRAYLSELTDYADQVLVMTSAGGLVPAAEAAERPVELLLSGPAGGVLAGTAAAVANGWPDAITFDMGGTSTDVCLALDGRPAPAADRVVAGFAIRVPSLDVHTIGAGGGSIARLDAGGALVVGPRSAGAVPGPVCYRRGGTEPTVTDADLVAGRIPADAEFPGIGRLDVDAAAAALATAGLSAEGVLAVVDAAMVQALRAVSVERGIDPRGLALVAFGGAGPLHACTLADALDMPAVIVPARAGVLSAVGILGAPRQASLVRSWPHSLDHEAATAALHQLGMEAAWRVARSEGFGAGSFLFAPHSGKARFQSEDGGPELVVHLELSVDARYEGQSHEIPVPEPAAFHREHRRRNGYDRPGHPVEVVALRARAWVPSPVPVEALPPVERSPALGPTVVAEPDCTIWIREGWAAEPGRAGAFVLRRTGGGGAP